MISIIIPFKDKIELLQKCLESILQKTSYENYEVILVDNNSVEEKTDEYLKRFANNEKIKNLDYADQFNFSAINNFAVKHAKGEYLLFLNNDTEVISENWLEEMLKCFEDEKVGAVGVKLLYPNGAIQHAGVMLEEKRLAIHAFRTWKEEEIKFDEPREWGAVTAACMMTRKDLFEKIGGFDEKNLPIAYNDVDYCLKLRDLGHKIICTPHAKLYHHESASRKSDVKNIYKLLAPIKFLKFRKLERYRKFLQEQKYMRKRWGSEIANDPFYDEKFI
ncbi:MAG: glycosyltransferase family 2 protein [Candidatus Moranbacteria bacterium]|nr:glycosyltransferase family 2 protein [Candidatus Moranbacteria bacterium]